MTAQHAQPARVAVVGCGNVGATFAYALLLSGLAAEIVLIDYNRQNAEGEAMPPDCRKPQWGGTRVAVGSE